MSKIALLHSTIRAEEKLLVAAAKRREVDIEVVDVRSLVLDPERKERDFDVVLERCVSTVKGMYAVRFFESSGIAVINSSRVAQICHDKFVTSLVLAGRDVPTPRFAMAFSEESAKQAVRRAGGFPVIIKPPLGSWGRLLAKVNDGDALEAVLEHKTVLGTPPTARSTFRNTSRKERVETFERLLSVAIPSVLSIVKARIGLPTRHVVAGHQTAR